MRMDITNRNTDNDNRNAVERGVDDRTVVSAAFAYRRLYSQTFFFCKIQYIALISRRADDGFIHETEHGAFSECSLDRIRFGKGVICRAALKAQGDLRCNLSDGRFDASFSKFLLCGQYADQIDIQILC